MTTAPAMEVARYLFALAESEEEGPEVLTPLRLQKLLYYVQGWSLGLRNRPMFSERIEAWAYGPVVPDVYHKTKSDRTVNLSGREPKLSDDDREFVRRVWEVYRPFSGLKLSEMTHNEAPWKDARGKLSPRASSTKEITHAAMKRFFRELSEAAES